MDVTGGVIQVAARWGLQFTRPQYLACLWGVPALWALGAMALRKTGAARLAAALCLRTAAYALAVLALAGLSAASEELRPATVIAAVDVSDSMGEAGRRWAVERATGILTRAAKGAVKGVTTFARGSSMRHGVAAAFDPSWFENSLSTDATDISSAIRTACFAFPAGGPKRLLLFSDGNENSGDAREAAAQAARAGIRIDCFSPPAPAGTQPRAALKKLDLPEEVDVSEKFTLRILAENRAAVPAAGELSLREGGNPIKEWRVVLDAGTNAFELPYRIPTPGTHRLTASLNVRGGPRGGSGVSAPILVVDRPKVLCVSGTGEGRNFLAEAIASKDIDVKVGGAELLPNEMDDLLAYDCVILSNVPRAVLGEARMGMLRRYVRELGGGLIMLGGAGSFGPGGYKGTPVEEILPVDMQEGVPFEKEKLVRLCIILVIDKSGSMGFGFGGKMIAARRAAEELVKQLKPNDMVGIIPFDADYSVLVPLDTVDGRKQQIIDRIRMIEAGGDTLISRPLHESFSQMQAASGKVKHVILLTDGQTKDVASYDYRNLIAAFRAAGITVSTVGIGSDADSNFLRAVALGSGGEYYQVKDATTLPLILLQDTRAVLDKSGFLEDTIRPKIGAKSEMLSGIGEEQIPPLLGYVITTPKRRAEVALYTDIRGVRDPLLVAWRAGTGKAVAFTSDAEARWSREMVNWRMFGKFWTQVLRWAMRERPRDFYLARARKEGDRQVLELRTFSPAGPETSFGLRLGGGRDARTVRLHQSAPGIYSGEAGALPPALDSVIVEKHQRGKVVGRKETALFRRVSPTPAGAEAAVTGNDEKALRTIAQEGGGRFNPREDELAFAPEKTPAARGLSGWLFPAIIPLLLADIAVRKMET